MSVHDLASPPNSYFEIADMDDLTKDYVQKNINQLKVENTNQFGIKDINVLIGATGNPLPK